MKEVIEKLRNNIKKLAVEQVQSKKAIRELAWKPGAAEAFAQVRSERGEDGYRIYGKRALKSFRRPETGEERCQLWVSHVHRREVIRANILALGFLRGLPYKEVEPNASRPLVYRVVAVLRGQLGNTCPYESKDIEEWINGGAASREVV